MCTKITAEPREPGGTQGSLTYLLNMGYGKLFPGCDSDPAIRASWLHARVIIITSSLHTVPVWVHF